MTTIAYKNGILAADKQATYGSIKHPTTKIWRLGDGSVAGGAGELSFIHAMMKWLDAGGDPATFPAHQRDKDDWQPIMVVRPNGQIQIYERTPYPTISEGKYFAIGSGREFAFMAMRLGKSAAEAVALTSEFDPGTGSLVDTLTLPDALRAHPPVKFIDAGMLQRQQLQEPGLLVPARA
jgi:hypothetical protein